jgi:hypothetical protein
VAVPSGAATGHRNVPSGSPLTCPGRAATVVDMRAGRRILVIVLLVQVAWALPLGVILGATMDWTFLYAFGGATLAIAAVLLAFMLGWQRADGRREALLSTGTRVPALLVASRATGTRINNRRVVAHTFESRAGGRVIRAQTRAFTHLPIGTEATIAYDATDPAHATVVEDLDERAASENVDWRELRRREADRMFRKRQ